MDANNLDSHSFNQIVSTSFADVHVKRELEEGGTNNNLTENCIPTTTIKNNTLVHCESKSQMKRSHDSAKNKVISPILSGQFKKEPIEDEVIAQCTTHQHVNNTITCTKTKTLENSKNIKKSETGKKRKDFEEKLQLIRKSLKLIPADGSGTLPTPSIKSHTVDSSRTSSAEAQILRKIIPIVPPVIDETNLKNRICPIIKETSIHESSKVAEKDNMDNDDIDILPVPVVKKNILVITLSDDEEELSKSHSKSTKIKHSKNSLKKDVVSDQGKKKLAGDKTISHDVSKTKKKQTSLTSKVSQSDKSTKRRPDCEEAVSKRFKRKSDEASQKHSFLLNKSCTEEEQNVPVAPMIEKQILENTINRIIKEISDDDDDESSKETEDHSTHTDAIVILPVVKVEKDVSGITVSCDKECKKNGNGAMESNNYGSVTPWYVFTSTCSTELGKMGNVSTDILRYFNVVSDLDRYECEIALEYLSNFKTKSCLDEIFPIIKKENKTAYKIKEGDILFENLTTEAEYESESAPILQNVNISSEQISENTAQLVPQCSSVSALAASLPVASNIENNLSISLQPNTDPSALSSNILHAMSYGQIEAMLKTVKLSDIDQKLGIEESKVASADPPKIPVYPRF